MSKRLNKYVDEYINEYSDEIKSVLQKLRELVLSLDQNITETFKYNMPSYYLTKNIFHFAVNKNHIGIYPTPEPIIVFEDELKKYKTSKGAIQIPYNSDFPFELILRIAQSQVNKYKSV